MTTGNDETGRRSSGPNLLAPLPGDPAAPGTVPAAFEEVRAAVLDIRERLTALETAAAAERPEPVTREALDAWGERLLKRFDDEGVPERAMADDGVLIVAECAARMTDAARGIEEGAAGAEKRLMNRIGEAEETLGQRLSATDTTKGMDDVRQAAGRIESEVGAFRSRVDSRFNYVATTVSDIQVTARNLQFRWRAILSPWAIFVFLLGMASATSFRLADRLL